MDLLKGLGSIRDTYILEAEDLRQGKQPAPRLSLKRVLLIAAVIALAMLLVGCGIVYVLRMQDLKVGEYSDPIPTAYDEYGELLPVPSQEVLTQFSLQGGANMEALAEWTAFLNTYDPDLSKAQAADKAAREGSPDSPWNLPDNYHLTYGCYNQEMVDKLDAVVKAYDLKLLSAIISLNWYESSVLLDSLGIESLLYDSSGIEYWGGNFHLEGTFDLDLDLTRDMGSWTWQEGSISYRFSQKEYFDPRTGYMRDPSNYTQWDYTRKDGKTLLLVLNENTAQIYADLPDAFVSITLEPVIWVDGEEKPMTQEALEQLAELFDLSISPQETNLERVNALLSEAQAAHEAQRAAQKANHEAQYALGYSSFVKYCLENYPSPETASYILYDINGDNAEELIISGWDILSKKDGQSFRYFDMQTSGVFLPRFRPCEGSVFEVWCEDFGFWQHYFYEAGPQSPVFLTGVIYDSNNDIWYRSLSGGAPTENRQEITKDEAQAILDRYTPIDFDWLPLKQFGKRVASVTYQDPYAKYIAQKMERYDNASKYQYALLDLNGDGIQELIARDVETSIRGEPCIALSVHTLVDGKLADLGNGPFQYVCQGGVLEVFEDRGNGDIYHAYYQCTAEGTELIEKVIQDPGTLYWHHIPADQDGQTVREETALAIIASHPRISLEWKLFTEYPLR